MRKDAKMWRYTTAALAGILVLGVLTGGAAAQGSAETRFADFDTNKDEPEPKRLLVGVNSDEITGFTITPDRRTAFINIQ
ncbi:MAG: PhoX family protein, partial [Pirellulales bacterium]|nr:PhoX family protein [Pirellulales bacterium]